MQEKDSLLEQAIAATKQTERSQAEDLLKALSEEVVLELAGKNPAAKRIFDSYDKFQKQVTAWHDISEREYLNIR